MEWKKRYLNLEDTILLSHTDSESRALYKLVVCLGSNLSKHLGQILKDEL